MKHVKIIGDALTQLDRTIAQVHYYSVTTTDPANKQALVRQLAELERRRDALDEKQRGLVKKVFNENTAAYKDFITRVQQLNRGLVAVSGELKDFQTTLAGVARVIGVVDQLINVVAGIV